jgi:uncharacterized protein YdeI (BOF family)
MKTFKILTSTLAALAIVAAWSGIASASNPYAKADEEWISLTGEVSETRVDGFELDYGDGHITVEMDDWDTWDESSMIPDGERVTVYGRVDDALFEQRTIEAGSVYVFSRNQFYYASSMDEEGDATFPGVEYVYPYIEDGSWIQMSGTVESIDGDEFTLDVGYKNLRVDIGEMAYDPLDDIGYQQVDVGDRVSVWGHLDYDLFEGRELEARTLITIRDHGDDDQDMSS